MLKGEDEMGREGMPWLHLTVGEEVMGLEGGSCVCGATR